MSYTGGHVFYGFELPDSYLKSLMSDSNDNTNTEVVLKIRKLLDENSNVKAISHVNDSSVYIYTDAHKVGAADGDNQANVDLYQPPAQNLINLKDAVTRLGVTIDEEKIGWHLAAQWRYTSEEEKLDAYLKFMKKMKEEQDDDDKV